MQSHINASRLVLASNQLNQFVSVKDPEPPLVPTGFENCLGIYSHMINRTEEDSNYEIIARFDKNERNYVLIGYDKKRKHYHAWKRVEMEEHSEGFCTRYNNQYLDSLEIGDKVPGGTYIQKSTNFDKFMNYQFGKNVNTVYLVTPYVYEDGLLIMNGAEELFDTYRSHTVEISLSDNTVLLNWFGDDDHYQGIPLVGQKTRNGFCAITRRIDNSKAPYSLKKKKLKDIQLGDKCYYVNGRVVDIDILTNKDPKKMAEAEATKIVADLYDEQQKYYKALYRFMMDIVDGSDDGDNYTYSDDFSIICDEAREFVDSSSFFADESDTVYGSTKIILHILDEEHLIVGSKVVGRSGNKGVIGKILPPEESWHMEDGTPIHFVVAALGVVGRLNPAQLNEHTCNELGATAVNMMKATSDLEQKGKIVYNLLKCLNKDEADEWKSWYKNLSEKDKAKTCRKIEKRGITIVQPPIDNANITHFEKAYEKFPPNFQRIIFADGRPSMRRVQCAKTYYLRLKQDPLEKYSSRSRGPVNPLTTLPAKSTLRKKFLAPFSDAAIRFGEMELEILMTMVNHPAMIADFMVENSTSFEAKLALSEQIYLGDPDEEISIDSVPITGKKNTEWIQGIINVLGTDIEIETERAPEGEWFYD